MHAIQTALAIAILGGPAAAQEGLESSTIATSALKDFERSEQAARKRLVERLADIARKTPLGEDVSKSIASLADKIQKDGPVPVIRPGWSAKLRGTQWSFTRKLGTPSGNTITFGDEFFHYKSGSSSYRDRYYFLSGIREIRFASGRRILFDEKFRKYISIAPKSFENIRFGDWLADGKNVSNTISRSGHQEFSQSDEAVEELRRYSALEWAARTELTRQLTTAYRKDIANRDLAARIEILLTRVQSGAWVSGQDERLRSAIDGSVWSFGKGWDRKSRIRITFNKTGYVWTEPTRTIRDSYHTTADDAIIVNGVNRISFNAGFSRFIWVDKKFEIRTGIRIDSNK